MAAVNLLPVPNPGNDPNMRTVWENFKKIKNHFQMFNVLDYGAKGDGVTDDSAAFARAFTAASGVGGGTVFIPGGTYLGNHVFSGEAKVIGAGQRATILKPYSSSLPCVRLYGSGGDANLGATISDLSIHAIQTLGVYSKAGKGLEFGDPLYSFGCSDALAERLDVRGFKYGVFFTMGIMCNLRQLWISDCEYGMEYNSEGNVTTIACDGVRLATCDYNIRMRTGVICSFTNCTSESATYRNLWLETYTTQGPTKLLFDNCWFEDITGSSGSRSCLYFDMEPSISAAKPMDVVFRRCVISAPNGIADMHAERAQNILFDTCVFSATADKFSSTKFTYATGDDSVRIKLLNCGTIQLLPTTTLYASFPALTRTSGGVFGYFYEYTGKNGKRYTNYERVSLSTDVDNYQVAYLHTMEVDTTLNNRAVSTFIGGSPGQFVDVTKPSNLFSLTIVNNGVGTAGYETIYTRSGSNLILTGNRSVRLAYMGGAWYEMGSNPTFIDTDFPITGALTVTKDSTALSPTILAKGVIPRYALQYTSGTANQNWWEWSVGSNVMVHRTRADDGTEGTTITTYQRTAGNICQAMQMGTRFEFAKGADVASANDLTLGTDGNYFVITGSTQINRLLPTTWQAGSMVILDLPASIVIKHNQSAGGGYVPIYLAKLADWTVGLGGGALVLVYNGTKFNEVMSVDYSGRIPNKRGADVASANDLTLGSDGTSFGITGSTDCKGIATAGWRAGSEAKLFLLGAITVKHNTAPSAGFAKFNLQGAADFVGASGAVLTVEYDGTVWQETARRTA
jgi:hypothetical protein